MEHKECLTKQGRKVEADFFRKNGKDWVKVRFFAYHVYDEFCLDKITFDEILDYLDNNFAEIDKKESEILDRLSELND